MTKLPNETLISRIKVLKKEFPTYGSERLATEYLKRWDYSGNHSTLARRIRRVKEETRSTNIKVFLFDVETAPLIVYAWNRKPKYIPASQIIKDWSMICWSGKFLFEEKIYSACQTPEEALARDDRRITESLWRMLDEADIVIAHNLNGFDHKIAQSLFLKHKMGPPRPYLRIDTLRTAWSQFKLTDSSLGGLAKMLNVPHGEKKKTDFQLWADCDAGDKDALEYMDEYCGQDVFVLEDVYLELRPYITNHPNMGVFIGSQESVCSHCGSSNLIWHGQPYVTTVNIYDAYKCGDCGSHGRSRRNSTQNKDFLVR